MSKEEKRLVIMLAQTDMNLDTATMIMIMVKQNKNGIKILTDYLNETNEHDSQKIIDIAEKIMKKEQIKT